MHLETVVEEAVGGAGGWKGRKGGQSRCANAGVQYLRIPLRTPLRAFKLMVEAIEDGVKEESKPSK